MGWPPSRMEEGPFKARAHIYVGFPGSQRKAGTSISYKTKSIPVDAQFFLGLRSKENIPQGT